MLQNAYIIHINDESGLQTHTCSVHFYSACYLMPSLESNATVPSKFTKAKYLTRKRT